MINYRNAKYLSEWRQILRRGKEKREGRGLRKDEGKGNERKW
jgi:hypothetical protein